MTPADPFTLNPFTFTDPKLSVMARGVLAVMAAHAHTGVQGGDIVPLLYESGDNKGAVNAAIDELVGAGLATRIDKQITFNF